MTLDTINTTQTHSVLVIDDELSILDMLKLMLTRKGLHVDTAQSGEEGIKKFESNDYKVVLTDMQMPGLSGNHVVEYIKDHKKSKIPVVGMSGTPWLLDKNKFDAILPKPSSIENIRKVVYQAVQK